VLTSGRALERQLCLPLQCVHDRPEEDEDLGGVLERELLDGTSPSRTLRVSPKCNVRFLQSRDVRFSGTVVWPTKLLLYGSEPSSIAREVNLCIRCGVKSNSRATPLK